jgi:predicted DNA-binding ribbon-helix-helix protein
MFSCQVPPDILLGESRRAASMQSGIAKRSVVIKGHKTSLTLEDPFWSALWEIARNRGSTMGGLVAQIDSERTGSNLSSAIRMYVLEYFKASGEQALEQ